MAPLLCFSTVLLFIKKGFASLALRPCQVLALLSTLVMTPGVIPGVLPPVESDVSTWQGEETSPSRPTAKPIQPPQPDQLMPACISSE